MQTTGIDKGPQNAFVVVHLALSNMKGIFSVINWLCCCGAFEDVFESGGDHEEDAFEEPLLGARSSMGLSAGEHQQDMLVVNKKKLNVNNILGFGRKDVSVDYEMGETLGEGAFGVVKRCQNKATGQYFACKTIEKRQLRRKADVEDIKREVQILMLLSSHPSVAALCAVYEDESDVHLILELCEGGQIFDRIISMGYITEQYISRVFRQMVELVDHCHTLGIAHRDIKPENFLFSTEKDDAVIKAADFGLSQFFTSGKPFKSLVGSAYYVAPEVLNRSYGPQADIWSLGVCLYVMLSGSPPFDGNGEEDIFDKIMYQEPDFSQTPWPSVSKHAKNLLKRLLQKKPESRPDTKVILQHRWLCEVAPHQHLDLIVVQRLRRFAGMTKVRHEALVAFSQAIEAGSTPEMLELVTKEVNNTGHSLEISDIEELLGKYNITVSSKVKESLSRYSRAQIGTFSAEDTIAAGLGRSEARRDEFLQRLYSEFDGGASRMPFKKFEKVLSTYDRHDTQGGSPSLAHTDIEQFNTWLNSHQGVIQDCFKQ